MNRRTLHQCLIAASILAVSCLAITTSAAAATPNIIYIMADDLGYGDLGCYGQQIIRTPRLDQMAGQGIRFTDHYSGSTVCAPSRSCLMTGQHTGHTRVRSNGGGPLLPEDVTVAEVLKGAGYATCCIGKWGLGEDGTTGVPNQQGFDHWFGYLNQSNAHFYYPPFLWRNREQVPLEGNDIKRQVGQFSHDLMTAEALEFIRGAKSGPFFLYVPYTIVHAEITVPEDSLAEYRGKFTETPYPGGHYGAHPTPRAARAGMITRLDGDVGRILDLLAELDIDDDTLVMFTSDNGPCEAGGSDWEFFDANGPLRGIKRDLYEGGIRVPMIARWPGRIEPSSSTDHPSAFWDLLPTCAELAGADVPEGVDGISFLPALLGRPQKKHDYLYWEFYEKGGKQAVRFGDWKGVRLNVQGAPEAPIELYNLKADLGEQIDLAAEEPELVEKITKIMKQAHTETDRYSLTKPSKKKTKK